MSCYNNAHRHSGINYVTQAQRHAGEYREILGKRKEVYKKAKERHPEHWSKDAKAWKYATEEWLNNRQEKETKNEAKAS